MTTEDVVKVVAARPDNRTLGDVEYWRDIVGKILPSVLDEVTQWFDWDFAMNDYSSVTTESGVAEYEFQGDNNDLRDIRTIRYGSNKTVLQKLRIVDAFDVLQGGSNLGGVKAWYQSGITVGGKPKITLLDTPTEAETLRILYRKSDIPIELFPGDFGEVLIFGIESYIRPETRIIFINAIKRMIKRHKVGGKDYNPVQGDPVTVRHNNDIFSLYGVG